LKTKYALNIIAILAGSVIPTQADEDLPRRSYVWMNYPHVGFTMQKGNDSAQKGDYETARQFYTAAIGQDPNA
jgi:hypothetical protein